MIQISHKQRCFFTAGASSDLDDGVLLVIRIARDQQSLSSSSVASVYRSGLLFFLGHLDQFMIAFTVNMCLASIGLYRYFDSVASNRNCSKLLVAPHQIAIFACIAHRGYIGHLSAVVHVLPSRHSLDTVAYLVFQE